MSEYEELPPFGHLPPVTDTDAGAQSLITGGLTGTVTDPSGGVIPGATVTLKNNGTGASQESLTNAQGFYRFRFWRPATTCSPRRRRISRKRQKIVQVQVGQISAVDMQLALQTAVGVD